MTPTRVLYPVPVERDEDGWWIHPIYKEALGDRETIPYGNPVFAGLEICLTQFDPNWLIDDADLCRLFLLWDGDKPDGDDWFLMYIGDTEDGYIAEWARPTGEQP